MDQAQFQKQQHELIIKLMDQFIKLTGDMEQITKRLQETHKIIADAGALMAGPQEVTEEWIRDHLRPAPGKEEVYDTQTTD